MSLTNMLRGVVLGISFAACNASSSDTPRQREQAECDNISQAELNRAFGYARRELETHGTEVRSAVFNDREGFAELADLVTYYAGCTSSRRSGPSPNQSDGALSYCGPGAVAMENFSFYPGDCLNGVCEVHDECYDGLLEELIDEDQQLCLWSNYTQSCDTDFFRGYEECREANECGFYCKLIGVIALNLVAIEEKYADFGPGCAWNEKYTPPKDKEPKDKKEPEGVDWGLRNLCSDFVDRMKRCDVEYLPPTFNDLLAGDGCVSENKALEKNRDLFECNYEKTCGDFERCVER